MPRICWNKDMLQKIIDRDGCIISDTVMKSKLGVDTNISYMCRCGSKEIIVKSFRVMWRNGGAFCLECMAKQRLENFKKTNMERYGKEFISQREDIKQQIIESNIKKHGVPHVFQSPTVRAKIIQTNIKNLGCPNPSQNEEVKEKKKQTCLANWGTGCHLQSQVIKDQIAETNIRIYGFENPFQNEQVKEKIAQTNMTNFGCVNPSQNEDVKQKKKDTCMKNYDVEHPMFSDVIKQRMIETCMEKYGVEYPMQVASIAEKASHNAYKVKPYQMSDGSIRMLQGFEHMAMDILTQTYTPDQIVSSRMEVPEIWYDGEDGKRHRYYVDVFLPEENRMIEVKSTYTFELEKDTIFRKKNACVSAGYTCELWVFNEKSVLVERVG